MKVQSRVAKAPRVRPRCVDAVEIGAARRTGRKVAAAELAVGEVVPWGLGRQRVVRSVTRLPGAGLVELVFEDWSVVQCAGGAYWKIISSPYDHLTDADIKAVFGWLCPGRGGGPVDAAGAA